MSLPTRSLYKPSQAISRHASSKFPAEPSEREKGGVRPLVLESWRRSLSFGLNPDAEPLSDVIDGDLQDYRQAHPLAQVLPVIEKLLIRHTVNSGLIVAIGDSSGRLLWVDGDRDLRRRAEAMAFIAGANWSEESVGTSAPGTALALGRAVQIKQEEHFNKIVHPWSCTAVPVHDRASGTLLGVIDITGRDDAVAPITLPLLEATVAAVEAELDLHHQVATYSQRSFPQAPPVSPRQSGFSSQHTGTGQQQPLKLNTPILNILGREGGQLKVGQSTIELSTRHAEILALLAWHPSGLTAQQLAQYIYGELGDVAASNVVTVRAEMVRLRKTLTPLDSNLVPLSRPYRLHTPIELDAQRLLGFLDRGAHRVAFACYNGPVLTGSTAPGIGKIRDHVSSQLRAALLTSANVETLLEYARMPEATYDLEVWQTCLRLLPLRSPKRTLVVAHLERIEAELA